MGTPTNRMSEPNPARASTAGWGLWLWWVLAGTLAFTVGGQVVAAIGPHPVTADYFGFAVAGILVGVLQSFGLWRRVSGFAWWMLAGVFAVTLVGFVVFGRGGGERAEVGWVVGAALFGTIVGVLQWWLLRRQVAQAGWWILASTGGWWMGMGTGDLAGFPALGAVYGAVTGAALIVLLRHPHPALHQRAAADLARSAWAIWIARAFKFSGVALGLVIVGLIAIAIPTIISVNRDPVLPLYAENCATCHGENLEGAAQGPALVGTPLVHGESVAALTRSIAGGFPELGLHAWSQTLDDAAIKTLAILVAERRSNLWYNQFRMDKELVIPSEAIATELATFRLETVATDIDPYSFSIAPLPDGRILVTEKKRGLSVVHPDGSRSDPILGTPQTSESGVVRWGLDYGVGWLLDVAPHPDFATNGWIYLHHTDVCTDCGLGTRSMNRLVRGRIRDGMWSDEEVIWSVPEGFYNPNADIGAGGRIAFDGNGFVYLSVGGKDAGFDAIRDLGTPYGKIHRVHDDGTVPEDNPFVHVDDAQSSIWTYGHRNPQGLEFDPLSRTLWNSEMGPRGGDEINLLQPGKNYGWPLYSRGVNYNGDPIDYLQEVGLSYEDIEQPVVDITPSTAVSSFIIYNGAAFPEWRGHFLVGSLIGTTLYRIVIEGGVHVHTEILLEDLARIRDVEMGPDGLVYLLLEHETGSRIVRLVPENHQPETSS